MFLPVTIYPSLVTIQPLDPEPYTLNPVLLTLYKEP